ncbi:hypothetical protein G6F22_014522 [Rhizopus arrhizus]|nr:hypothetical protein G6F22_014522 [Rhizopus arrhizus]KAG1198942.1 hypothetical protein G6F35_012567 [Rhizopus arrhizus]
MNVAVVQEVNHQNMSVVLLVALDLVLLLVVILLIVAPDVALALVLKAEIIKEREGKQDYSPRRRSRSPRYRRRSSARKDDKEFHGTREEPEVSNILGVFGLSLRTREADLEDVFHEFGTIEKVTIVYDHRTNRSRGFGFVYFKDQADASRARDALNGMDIDERKIRVDYSVTHRPHTPTPGQYMGERRPDNYDRGRRYRDRRARRSRSRSYDRRRKYYRSRSRSRSWSR